MHPEATTSAHTSCIVECRSLQVGNSTYRVDAVRFQPTDRPVEDRWSFHFEEATDRLVLGVYDGHGGPASAEVVSAALPVALMKDTPSMHDNLFEKVDSMMIKRFTDDHSFFHAKSDRWVDNAKAVKAGCMALVCDLDLKSKVATVSNAGDCRLAVLHHDEEDYRVSFETTDLNAKVSSEQERIKGEHPGEDTIIVSGRLFGRLMSTRGFGDAYYKLPCNGLMGKQKHRKYIDALSAVEDPRKVPINQQYDAYFYGYRTPPYITARPETSCITIADGDIIIMASDGLWDGVSTSGAAKIVHEGLVERVGNLALHLLMSIIDKHPPGDDTTIVILRTLA